jgi:RNA polymerase sigma-70 factor (ECF subfamily)
MIALTLTNVFELADLRRRKSESTLSRPWGEFMATSRKELDSYQMNESRARLPGGTQSLQDPLRPPAYKTPPKLDEVSQLILDWADGDQTALDKLMPLVYDELRRLAHNYMRREHPGHTLQTTALVDEAYLRLVDQTHTQWNSRAQFFGIAAQLMRRILVDHARSHLYAKRGGGARRVALDEVAVLSPERGAELIALDDALERLSSIDPRKSRVVELRYFGGLSVEETAEILEVSAITVKRDWLVAKAWLRREMSDEA